MAVILVIDDDPSVRRMISRTLRAAGHVTIEAASGKGGMDALVRDGPALVITDIMMPEQEGIETISQIRALSSVPILAVSGSLQTKHLDVLLDAQLMGADLVLPKPFAGAALIAAVAQLLETAAAPNAPGRSPT